MLVDELAAVIRVDPAQRERQLLLHDRHGLHDPVVALAPHRLAFYPAGLDIHAVQGMEKLSAGGGPGVRHQINFQIARLVHIPVVCLNGDLVLQQRTGPGGTVEPTLQRPFAKLQPPIHLPWADGQELARHLGGQRHAGPHPGQPLRQRRLQPLRTEIPGRFPHLGQHADHRLAVPGPPPRDTPGAWRLGQRPVEQPERILAMIPTHLSELVQHHRLLSPLGPLIPWPYHSQILVLRPSRHAVCLHAPSLGPLHADVEGKIGKWRNDLSPGKILGGAIRQLNLVLVLVLC